MLSNADISLLQNAYALLQAGDVAGAQAKLATLPEEKLQHPDVVHLLALILIALGETDEARDFLKYAVKEAPNAPSIWLTYGNFLGDLGDIHGAFAAFERAATLDPHSSDPLFNLGLTAMNAGWLDHANSALQRAEKIAPANTAIRNARGLLEQQRGNPDAAIKHYHEAILIDPRDARSRHNMGAALRSVDQTEAALEQIELAIALGSMAPESFTTRAHLLAELGRFHDAVGQYHEVVKAVPEHLDAHETLARLMPQLGVADVALESYKRALGAGPASPELWQSALSAAQDVGDHAQLLDWAHDAETAYGAKPEFTLAKATALSRSGDPKRALDLLQPLVEAVPDNAGIRNHVCHTLLMLGDPKKAEAHALRATALAPLDQFGWSYLTIIWRLLNDPREAWLADYERMVMTVDLDPEDEGQADAWFAPLRASVEQLHTTLAHPAEQSLRGGTQTRGKLFEKRNPDMRGFANHVRQAVESMLPRLPQDATHPFLRRNSGNINFAGSWSVRLASSGFHTNHIHQSGWLSSAFYLTLPPEVGTSQAGALTFGVPDAAFGLDLEPRRVEIPRAGRLVLFPSYFWHGTVPFESQSPRLTMAFDAVPVRAA
jgi:tetratricopeptide (TPR) repeat protein